MLQYGVVCTWGLSQLREQEVVQLAKHCAEEPLSMEEVEIDQVRFRSHGNTSLKTYQTIGHIL